MIYKSNKILFTFEKYIGFYFWNFYSLILPPGGKIMDPYFREKEPSEAGGAPGGLDLVKSSALRSYPGGFGYFEEHPALVHYSGGLRVLLRFPRIIFFCALN